MNRYPEETGENDESYRDSVKRKEASRRTVFLFRIQCFIRTILHSLPRLPLILLRTLLLGRFHLPSSSFSSGRSFGSRSGGGGGGRGAGAGRR